MTPPGATTVTQRWTVNAPRRGWHGPEVAELWRFRVLALELAKRDIRLRYAQTRLGITWVVIQPVLAMVVFSVFLGRLGGVSSDGQPYPVFVLAGLCIWFFVSAAVSVAAESLAQHRELVEKVYFPRLLAPIGAVAATTLDLAISLIVLALVVLVYGVTPGPQIVLAPVWLLGAAVVALGAGIWMAALNVLYRDVRYALGYLLQLWLFASPVVFASNVVSDDWRAVFAINPLVGVIDGFRWSVVDGSAPPLADVVSVITGALLLVTGLLYFQRVERQFADRI